MYNTGSSATQWSNLSKHVQARRRGLAGPDDTPLGLDIASLRRIILATVHCSHITSDFLHTIATDLFLLPGGGKKKKKTLRRPTVSRSDIFILELSLIGLTFSGNPELPTGFEGCRSHGVVRSLRVNKVANGRRKGLRVRVREVEAKSAGFGGLGGGWGEGLLETRARLNAEHSCRTAFQRDLSAQL